jgi:hypothetical protein
MLRIRCKRIAAWILEEFKSYSPRLEVMFDTYQIPKDTNRVWRGVELRNVVAILPARMADASNRCAGSW